MNAIRSMRAAQSVGLLSLALAMSPGLAGCRHKTVAAAPLPPIPEQTPVPLEPATTDKPAVVAKVPIQSAPLSEVTVQDKKSPRHKRKTPATGASAAANVAAKTGATAAPPSALVASATPPPAPGGAALGSLSAGGEETHGKTEQAKSMITDLERRLKNLEVRVQEQQREGLLRVRYFEKEASRALNMGDADGAVTLMTKAKLLLDDLVK